MKRRWPRTGRLAARRWPLRVGSPTSKAVTATSLRVPPSDYLCQTTVSSAPSTLEHCSCPRVRQRLLTLHLHRSIAVITRVRPFNQREKDLKTYNCIQMKVDDQQNQQVWIQDPEKPDDEPNKFRFDYCFDSFAPGTASFVGQVPVFESVGLDIVAKAWTGYNACIFAYGQTGSGKSYSIMGYGEDKGVIPRICEALFYFINKHGGDFGFKVNSVYVRPSPRLFLLLLLLLLLRLRLLFSSNLRCFTRAPSQKVDASYLEVYNEGISDLLVPKASTDLTEFVPLKPKERMKLEEKYKRLVKEKKMEEAEKVIFTLRFEHLAS